MEKQLSSISDRKSSNPTKTILLAGLVAGTLDITTALIHAFIARGITPERVFKFIASGVWGNDAFSGGTSMIFWGIFFHYVIAFTFTLFFFFIYPYVSKIINNKIVLGLFYGIFVWIVMNMLVLPLTNIPKGSPSLGQKLIGMAILMMMLGLPISLIINRYYSSQKA